MNPQGVFCFGVLLGLVNSATVSLTGLVDSGAICLRRVMQVAHFSSFSSSIAINLNLHLICYRHASLHHTSTHMVVNVHAHALPNSFTPDVLPQLFLVSLCACCMHTIYSASVYCYLFTNCSDNPEFLFSSLSYLFRQVFS